MSAIPVGSGGGKISNLVSNVNYKIRKHALRYLLAYILFFGFVTYYLRQLDTYALFWYPLIVSLEKATLLYSIYLYKNRLKFCVRKRIIILSLFYYEFLNAITIIFQLGESFYTNTLSYLLLTTAIVTILLTIYQNESNES